MASGQRTRGDGHLGHELGVSIAGHHLAGGRLRIRPSSSSTSARGRGERRVGPHGTGQATDRRLAKARRRRSSLRASPSRGRHLEAEAHGLAWTPWVRPTHRVGVIERECLERRGQRACAGISCSPARAMARPRPVSSIARDHAVVDPPGRGADPFVDVGQNATTSWLVVFRVPASATLNPARASMVARSASGMTPRRVQAGTRRVPPRASVRASPRRSERGHVRSRLPWNHRPLAMSRRMIMPSQLMCEAESYAAALAAATVAPRRATASPAAGGDDATSASVAVPALEHVGAGGRRGPRPEITSPPRIVPG